MAASFKRGSLRLGGKGAESASEASQTFRNIYGTPDSDDLVGGDGDDYIDGKAGDDVLEGGLGADKLVGGDGLDTATYRHATAGVQANLGAGGLSGEAAGDTYQSIEALQGSAWSDQLTGDAVGNILSGEGGEDRLYGLDGDDSLNGGAGHDYLAGGTGNDKLFGGDGWDFLDGGLGADRLDGGGDQDTVSYNNATAGVVANLELGGTAGEAAGDTYISIENLEGSNYADKLTGGAGANQLYGWGGDDQLSGGAGDDVLEGGRGADVLDGGDGWDSANYFYATAGVWASLVDGGRNGDAAGDVYIGVENLLGSLYGDVLIGDAEVNQLDGMDGADALYAGDGADYVIGGAGDDFMEGGSGADVINGGEGWDTAHYVNALTGVVASLATGGTEGDAAGDVFFDVENLQGSIHNDKLSGDANANLLYGWLGNDDLSGAAGHDVLYGGDGDDVLDGGLGADDLDGGAGRDRASYRNATAAVNADLILGGLGGEADQDTYTGLEDLEGSAYDDWLLGDAGGNALYGGVGDDVLEGRRGADLLDGGEGFDVASYYNAKAGVVVSLTTGLGRGDEAEGDRYVSIESLIGSNYNDVLEGNDVGNSLRGGDGGDSLYGLAGGDYLYGEAGEDYISGGEGADYLDGGLGADTLDGGAGLDTVSYVNARAGVWASLEFGGRGGDAAGDAFVSIEGLMGSNYGDVLAGDAEDNILQGLGGNDSLYGWEGGDRLYGGSGQDDLDAGAGGDLLYGEDGDDDLIGGLGADWLDGGAGQDTASYIRATEGVVANLAIGTGTGGEAAGDSYFGIENLKGSDHADQLTGDAGDNRLSGGFGNDILTGGAGRDAFVFDTGLDAVGNVDRIEDFAVSVDKIHLSSDIFAALTDGPLDPSAFIVGSAATQPGQHILYDSTTGALFYDADGSGAGAAVQFATLTSNLALTANDFLVI